MTDVVKLVLYSDMMCYGPEPPADVEIAQRVTLNANGKAAVTRYGYARSFDYERLQMARPRCGADKAKGVLDSLWAALESEGEPIVKDAPIWEAVFEFGDGSRAERCGSVVDENGVYTALSESLREALGAPYLFAFDGGLEGNETEEA